MLMAMVIARRSVSVFLAVWSVTNLLFGCVEVLRLDSLPPVSSCVTPAHAQLGSWLFTGLVLLVAAVLWFAPWTQSRANRTVGPGL
jgi:hypothetical protein